MASSALMGLATFWAADWIGLGTKFAGLLMVLVLGVLAVWTKVDGRMLALRKRRERSDRTSLTVAIAANGQRIADLETVVGRLRKDLEASDLALRKARADYGTALERARITSDALSEAHDRIIALESDLRRNREERDIQVKALQDRIASLERRSDDSSPALKIPPSP